MKNYSLLLLFISFSCKNNYEIILSEDSEKSFYIYKWNKKHENEYGVVYLFGKKNKLLKFNYLKKYNKLLIDKKDYLKPKKWEINNRNILVIDEVRKEIINYRNNTLTLIDVNHKDTSYLIKTNLNFIIEKKDYKDYLITNSNDTIKLAKE